MEMVATRCSVDDQGVRRVRVVGVSLLEAYDSTGSMEAWLVAEFALMGVGLARMVAQFAPAAAQLSEATRTSRLTSAYGLSSTIVCATL
jgi:hypothetical protein